MKPFAKVACDSAPKCGFDHGVVCNFGCLCAVWPQAELDMEYDMKILAEPAEHTSAAKDILDGDYLLTQPAALRQGHPGLVITVGCRPQKFVILPPANVVSIVDTSHA